MAVNREMLRQATELASHVGSVFVATCGADGMPHMAAAGKLLSDGDDNVAIVEWFCPCTVVNVRDNRRIALVVWNSAGDDGYQLLGEVTQADDLAVMDGYDPAVEAAPPQPQVERQLIVHVDKVIHFSQAPHSDAEE